MSDDAADYEGPTYGRADKYIKSVLESIAIHYPAMAWREVRKFLVAREPPSPIDAEGSERQTRLLKQARAKWARLSQDFLRIQAADTRLRERLLLEEGGQVKTEGAARPLRRHSVGTRRVLGRSSSRL